MSNSMRPRRACDRCHALKERCRWADDSAKCDRCSRLDQACHTDRPANKIGRKPRSRPLNLQAISSSSSSQLALPQITPHTPLQPSAMSPSSSTLASPEGRPTLGRTPDSMMDLEADILQSLSIPDELDDLERMVLGLCFANQETVGQFTIGKSFHKLHQRDLLTRLSKATVQLKDGFICCGAMFAQSLKIDLPPEVLQMCTSRAASAVVSLRGLEITSRQDVSTCLVLGLVVTTFAIYVAGGETESICRWILAQLKPLCENDITLAPDELSFLNCLIFTEIVECLLKAHIPTLQFKIASASEVDRYFGLSTPVMTHLHDICIISNALTSATEKDRFDLLQSLDHLEYKVRKWQPILPENLMHRYDQSEITNILCQAKSLRLTALLLVHRLRYPFGQQIEYGRVLSEAIMIEINLAKQITNQMAEGLDLAVMISFYELEAEDDRKNAFARFDSLLQYSASFRARFQGQLTSVWSARNSGKVVYLYDLRHYLPP